MAKGLMITCPSCGRQSAKWARFCSKCGRRMPRPGEIGIHPSVHRDAAPTYQMEPVDREAMASDDSDVMAPVDSDAMARAEAVDADATGPIEPFDADATAPIEPADGPRELPTPVHMPAVDPPVRPTVARPRVRSSPPPRAPSRSSGSARALVFAAGGAAVLLIIVGGYLIGKSASSGSNSSNSTASVSQPAGNTGTSASTSPARASTTTTAAGNGSTSVLAATKTTTFTGREFSIKYPIGWIVATNQKQYPWGTDTTVVSPSDAQTLLRVDVSPHVNASSPLASSQAEIDQVSKQPGYQQLGLTSNTVNGSPGERWEFLVTDNGVLEHSVDEFVITPKGDGLAILTQAPASKYASLAREFTALRQTLAVHSS